MIEDSGLQWCWLSQHRDPSTGGECATWRCVEHPRLLWMEQRPNKDADWTNSYSVEGIAAQYYHSPADALLAMDANP